MRILISVDMEGIAGIAVPEDVRPGGPEYERGRHLMTREASAAVRGALQSEPQAEVLVADAHGPFINLLPEELDPRARLLRGRPRPLGMVTLLDEVDLVIFIGYHGQAGTASSVLSHTISGAAIHGVRCQGRPLGEIGLNSALAGHYGIPVCLVAGDDTVAKEAEEMNPGVTTVTVKRALGAWAADSLHPERACQLIEEAVPGALKARQQVRTLKLEGAVEIEVDFHREVMAEPGMLVPGVRRLGATTLGYRAEDYLVAYEMIRLLALLAGTV